MRLSDYPPQEPLSAVGSGVPRRACHAPSAPRPVGEHRRLYGPIPTKASPSIARSNRTAAVLAILPRRRLDRRLQGVDVLHGAGVHSRRHHLRHRSAIAWRPNTSFRPASRTAPRPWPGCCARGASTAAIRPLFVGGHSAGGHYAALLARHARLGGAGAVCLRRTSSAAACPFPASTDFDADGSGLSVRPRFLGPVENDRAELAAAPLAQLQPDACPPFLLAHGEAAISRTSSRQADADGRRAARAPAVPVQVASCLRAAIISRPAVAGGEAAAGWVATAAAWMRRAGAKPTRIDHHRRHEMNRIGTRRRMCSAASRWPSWRIAVGAAGAAQADKPRAHRLLDGAHRHAGERHAVAAQHLRAVARAGQRRAAAWTSAAPSAGRVRRLRRPVEARAGGAHLREADHRRQGRPAARALGHAVPHRDRAGAREVQVPDGRQHRGVGDAAPGQARLHLVPDLGDPGPHRPPSWPRC